jgi:hypothetical protein
MFYWLERRNHCTLYMPRRLDNNTQPMVYTYFEVNNPIVEGNMKKDLQRVGGVIARGSDGGVKNRPITIYSQGENIHARIKGKDANGDVLVEINSKIIPISSDTLVSLC